MYRFFLYFLARENAEKTAESLRGEGFKVWSIQPGWDDPFCRLEVRRQLAAADLGDAIKQLKAAAGRFGGEYSGSELLVSDPAVETGEVEERIRQLEARQGTADPDPWPDPKLLPQPLPWDEAQDT